MTLTDWLPVVSGTALGLAGIGATLLSGTRQQRTATEVVRLQAEHQARASRAERVFELYQAAYGDLSAWLGEIEELARADFRRINLLPSESLYGMLGQPEGEDRRSRSLRTSFLWPQHITEQVWEFVDLCDSIHRLVVSLTSITASDHDRVPGWEQEAQAALPTFRRQVRALRSAIKADISGLASF